MGTPSKSISATARTLVLTAALLGSVASAGPLDTLASTVHKGAGTTARAGAMSLATLRPTLSLAQRPQMAPMALDSPRRGALRLQAPESRLPPAEEPRAGMHTPQGLHWEDASAPVSPHLVTLVRNYHHDGLPVVKLWQADRNMVSVGLNPHGVPGIFFTQTMGK
jgi:hypothetical protein